MNLDARNLLNYKPAYYYDGTAYSYNEMPKTSNVSVLLRYTQRFGHSRVRVARDRSGTNHLGRFEN